MRIAILIFAFLTLGCSSNRKFVAQKPIPSDTRKIEKPFSRDPSLSVEIIDKTFNYQLKQIFDFPRSFRKLVGEPYQSLNVDNFDNVPNSSWFTNRNGFQEMSLEEIRKGPNKALGPDTTGTWKIVSVKTAGVTPGFTIVDSKGAKYVIKFDPLRFPELASGTEVVGTKLMFAAGYNVPENYIAYLNPEKLVLSPEAKLNYKFDKKRPMTQEDLEVILKKVNPNGEKRIRVLASRFLSGIPIGPWTYTGTRKDDPNDIFSHENRREIRGLYILCSWINHADMKEENTLDMFDEGFVKHYLIDFGASMGSNSTNVSNPRRGQANSLDLKHSLIRLATLGLYVFPYERAEQKIIYPSVGYLENDLFHPNKWNPMYPVPAFENLTKQDAFWGTKIVTSFSDEQIQAAVLEGQFSDPNAAKYLEKFLIERRDKIGNYWFSKINPLDNFEIENETLHFEDLAFSRGFAKSEKTNYKVEVFNQKKLISSQETKETSFRLLQKLKGQEKITLSILTKRKKLEVEPIRVYLKLENSDWKILGIERE
ncbi:MAG: hypothetical protein DWQ06_01925 [Calditrichaeota bacterium]|nr:MAG: hypothetical protein DWQ06_01925 [Calditrichota bacterium]